MARGHRAIPTLFACAVLIAVCAAGAVAEESGNPLSSGWEALWTNEFTEAERFFRAAISAGGDEGSARRGLILALLARGKDDPFHDELTTYARKVPVSPYDFFVPEVARLYSELNSREYHETLFDYSRNLGRGKNLAPVDRRVYKALASDYALLAGEGRTAKKLGEELNRIDRWYLLGPFDNTSGSGHGKDHADTKFPTRAPYTGKFGQSITWFTPRLVSLSRAISPSEYFHQSRNTTAYLRTVAEIKKAGTYLISVGYSGDMEFRINEVLVGEGSRHAGGDEVLQWHVDLPSGKNLFAFKLSKRDDMDYVTCAISEIDGSRVKGISFDSSAKLVEVPRHDLNPRPVEASFLRDIDARMASSPDDAEAEFWNLHRMRMYARPDSTTALCERVAERHPGSALMLLAVAATYGAADEEDEFEQFMSLAAELEPELAPATLHLARKDFDKKRYEIARSAAEVVLLRAPSCREALELRLECLLEEQKLEELRDAAEKMTKELRDEPLGYYYLARYASARGLAAEEKRQNKKMVKRMPVLSARAVRYFESAEEEDHAEVEKELKRFLDLAPDTEYLWVSYVGSLLAQDKLEKAWETVNECLKSFPQSIALIYYLSLFLENGYDFDDSAIYTLFPDGERTLTDEELEMMWPDGDSPTRVITLQNQDGVERWFRAYSNSRAADALEEALAIDPGSFEIRDKIRSLRGRPSYRTFMPDPTVDAVEKMRVDPAKYEGDDALVLMERKRRLVYDAHASVLDYIIAVQILNEEGIRRWENFNVSVNPHASDLVFIERKTIKPDGMEYEAETMGSRVIFSNVEVDDLLFLHYQSTAFVSGALSGNFWDYHHFSFRDPCLESSYTLIAPAGTAAQTRLHNREGYSEAIVYTAQTLEDGYESQEWLLRNPPRTGRELGSPPARSYLPWLDVSSIESWSKVAEWYEDVSRGQAEVTRSVRKKSAELTEGAATDEEKIGNVFRFVSGDITYQFIPFYQSAHVPREADEVLRDRFGDCKDKCILMIALLDAAGIGGCYPALVTPNTDASEAFLPSPRFEHVLVCRELPDGGERWYDPTVRFPDPGQIPGPLSGALALVAKHGESDLSLIPEADACEHPRIVETAVVLTRDGDATVERQMSYTRIDATSSRRSHLQSTSQEDLEDEVLAGLASKYPGAELLSLEVSGEEDAAEPLVYDFSFEIPGLFASTGNILSGTVPSGGELQDAFGGIVAKKERESPVDLRGLERCDVVRAILTYPEGLVPIAVPESCEYRFGDCAYRATYETGPNSLTVERELVISGGLVDTASSIGDQPVVAEARRLRYPVGAQRMKERDPVTRTRPQCRSVRGLEDPQARRSRRAARRGVKRPWTRMPQISRRMAKRLASCPPTSGFSPNAY